MSLHELPADLLRDLLLNVEGEISAACPFAFLLDDESAGELQPHLAWLEEHELLDSPAEQGGRVAIAPALRHALDILVRPVRRILVSELDQQGMRRSVHVSDGAEAVIAMFDSQHCLVSDPLDLESFCTALVEAIGPPKVDPTSPPLQLPTATLGFLGAVTGPWGETGEAVDAPGRPALAWPIERADGEERLTALIEDAEMGGEILEALIADHILQASNGKLDIHPDFVDWDRALSAGDLLEIQRLEIPDSDLTQAQPPVRAYFAGKPGERCLLWPAEDEPGQVILTQPTTEELRSVVGYLVGYIDSE